MLYNLLDFNEKINLMSIYSFLDKCMPREVIDIIDTNQKNSIHIL